MFVFSFHEDHRYLNLVYFFVICRCIRISNVDFTPQAFVISRGARVAQGHNLGGKFIPLP